MNNNRKTFSILVLTAAAAVMITASSLAQAAGPTPAPVAGTPKPVAANPAAGSPAPVTARPATPSTTAPTAVPMAAAAPSAAPPLPPGVKINEAKVISERDPKLKIQGLQWRRDVLLVSPDPRTGTAQPMVRLEGLFPKGSDRTLFLGKTQINTSPKDGSFDLLIHLKGNSTALIFQTVDKARKVTAERVVVNFPAYPQFVASKSTVLPPGKTSTPFSFGLGVSSINYQETSFKDLAMTALTAKGAYSKPLGQGRWEAGVNAYVTAFPLSSNRTGFTFRFFGTNFRIGANLLPKTSPWKLAISSGMYYTTTIVSTPSGKATFGFNNMYGPQLLTVLGRRVGEKNFLGTYFKYAPIMDGIVPTTASAEMAYGLNFTRRLQSGNAWSLSLDAATLKINIQDTILITSKSYSLGVSFIF